MIAIHFFALLLNASPLELAEARGAALEWLKSNNQDFLELVIQEKCAQETCKIKIFPREQVDAASTRGCASLCVTLVYSLESKSIINVVHLR